MESHIKHHLWDILTHFKEKITIMQAIKWTKMKLQECLITLFMCVWMMSAVVAWHKPLKTLLLSVGWGRLPSRLTVKKNI